MNIVKSTANKVQELEKRLDNAILGEGLRVSEIKREFESEMLSENVLSCVVLSVMGGEKSENIVLQGEIKVHVYEATNLHISLVLDGYTVYDETRTVAVGAYTWSMIKTLNIAPEVSQDLILKVWTTGGGSSKLIRYNFYLWGYGESVTLGTAAVEPKLEAVSESDRYVIYLVLNDVAYVAYIWDFPESLSIDDFSYFGEISFVAAVQYPIASVSPLLDYGDSGGEGGEETEEETRTPPMLYSFVVDKNKNLYMISGENESFSSEGLEIIDSNVSSVTATITTEGEIVVVYSKEKEIYYFTFDTEIMTEPVVIRSFNEKVETVSLIRNCTSTTFLVVGVESGKNFLLSSATNISETDKHSYILVNTYLDFS